jgi:hypothetical protein
MLDVNRALHFHPTPLIAWRALALYKKWLSKKYKPPSCRQKIRLQTLKIACFFFAQKYAFLWHLVSELALFYAKNKKQRLKLS